MSLSVLIPSRTDEYLDALFASMEASQPGSTAACIVGDNGLSASFRERWSMVQFVEVPTPFVFAKAINACAAKAPQENDLLVLNDDTQVLTPYWLQMIEEFLGKRPNIQHGMLSLRIVGGVGNEDQKQEVGIDEIRDSANVICFVAVLIPRKVWNQVGALDERFIGYGMDDNDYARRCVDAGFRLGVTGVAVIKHGGKKLRGNWRNNEFHINDTGEDRTEIAHSSSYLRYLGGPEWTKQYELNQRLYEAKWGLSNVGRKPMPKDATSLTEYPQAGRVENSAAGRTEASGMSPAALGVEASRPTQSKPLHLNLGCGQKALRSSSIDWVNLDIRPLPGVDVVRDLKRGLPFNDETFDFVFADNVLEHFVNEDFIFILNEIDRVLKPRGTCIIIVPDARSQASVQDPTHKMYFVPRSSLYWNQMQTPNGGKAVGITANLLPLCDPECYGDPNTESFIKFQLRKEPLK